MTLQELAQQIADFLPDFQARSNHNNNRAHLEREDGATVTLCPDRLRFEDSKRLEIIGAYAQHNGHWYGVARREDRSRITVAISRVPAAIAKDIARRLLPKYLPLYEESVRAMTEDLAAEADTADTLALIGEILGVEASTNGINSDPSLRYYGEKASAKITAYRGQVEMQLHNLTVAQAQRIALVLRQ